MPPFITRLAGLRRVRPGSAAQIAALVVTCVAMLAASRFAAAASAACSVHSPAHRVALVELYSSEGCSSCPPADQWLSQWKDDGAAHDIVPLALHVDYWNSLGWTDRFAQHRFAERQQTLTGQAGRHTIYTPEVFVAGRELRGWSQPARFAARVREVSAQPAGADIALALTPAAQGFAIDARFGARADAPAGAPLDAYVAVYENALTSQVSAGENRGATLHHDRVVRAWFGPVPLAGGRAQIRRDFAWSAAHASPAGAGQFGVVAFVENASSGEVLQATDLPAACH
jgi:hypothetical protein